MKHLAFIFLLTLLACGEDSNQGQRIDASVQIDAETQSCPSHLRFELVPSQTNQILGTSGNSHTSSFAEFTFSVALDCDSDCRVCNFSGPTALEDIEVKRCREAPHITCSTDEDCPGPTPGLPDAVDPRGCRYLVSPPTSVIAGGTPTCFLSFFPSDEEVAGITGQAPSPAIEGTIDLRDGRTNFERFIRLTYLNQTGLGTTSGLCQQCVGDPIPNDGKAEGQCQAAEGTAPTLNDGGACDLHSFGGRIPGTFSMDCASIPPYGSTLLSNTKPTTDGTQVVLRSTGANASPDCTATDADDNCLCGVCSDTNIGCFNDGDCPEGSTCGWLPSDCEINDPADPKSFDPAIFPYQCKGQSSIATRNNYCPAGEECMWNEETTSGVCSGPQAISCFPSEPDSIIRSDGSNEVRNGVYIIKASSISCVGPRNPTLDFILGLPGPSVDVFGFRVIKEYR